MMMFWAWAGVPLGVYNIVSSFPLALQIQPQILSFLSLTTWIQVYYYEKKWSVPRSLCVVVPIAALMACIELGLVYALRHGERVGVHWPNTLMAVLAALFLALGVLRHYWDIYVHRTVRGISFIFCGIDAMGDLTSLLAILFQPEIDVLGIVVYGVELALWIGVFACGGYLNLVPWLRWKVSSRSSEQQHETDIVVDEIGTADAGVESGDGTVALHDLPSSTSVFRTSSGTVDTTRARVRRPSLHSLSSPVM